MFVWNRSVHTWGLQEKHIENPIRRHVMYNTNAVPWREQSKWRWRLKRPNQPKNKVSSISLTGTVPAMTSMRIDAFPTKAVRTRERHGLAVNSIAERTSQGVLKTLQRTSHGIRGFQFWDASLQSIASTATISSTFNLHGRHSCGNKEES